MPRRLAPAAPVRRPVRGSPVADHSDRGARGLIPANGRGPHRRQVEKEVIQRGMSGDHQRAKRRRIGSSVAGDDAVSRISGVTSTGTRPSQVPDARVGLLLGRLLPPAATAVGRRNDRERGRVDAGLDGRDSKDATRSSTAVAATLRARWRAFGAAANPTRSPSSGGRLDARDRGASLHGRGGRRRKGVLVARARRPPR